jgi:hypothetical protein
MRFGRRRSKFVVTSCNTAPVTAIRRASRRNFCR